MQRFRLAEKSDIDELGKNKARLILMNKADLADSVSQGVGSFF